MEDWLTAKIAPMLASTGEPFDSERYLFEIKWDGIRMLAFFGNGVARLQGRKKTEATHRYPEVERALKKLPGSGVVDGEIVVLDDDGRPNFQRVLIREQTSSRDGALLRAKTHPVVFMVFDVLYRDGVALVDRPLLDRKKVLAALLADAPSPIVESTYVLHRGKAMFQQAKERGLEGVIAKACDSRYLMGERTSEWLKLKVRHQTDGVLMGTVREHGTGRVKSLVLGAYDDGTLRWLGNVGSGLNGETIAQLETQLGPLKSDPPTDFAAEAPGKIEWLRPLLVVRVEYSELTMDRRLRHPVFVGFVDKDPSSCDYPR